MKYKLIIDKNAEEEIIAIVHAPSKLTEQIENLVCSFEKLPWNMEYCLFFPELKLASSSFSISPGGQLNETILSESLNEPKSLPNHKLHAC